MLIQKQDPDDEDLFRIRHEVEFIFICNIVLRRVHSFIPSLVSNQDGDTEDINEAELMLGFKDLEVLSFYCTCLQKRPYNKDVDAGLDFEKGIFEFRTPLVYHGILYLRSNTHDCSQGLCCMFEPNC